MFSTSMTQNNEYLMIPKSSLGYATNNKYAELPPFMADGRSVFASWQPEALINQEIVKENNLKTNWEYRQFMMKNGVQIMEYNKREACNDVGYYKRYVPEKMADLDNEMRKKHTEYETTDLKQMYLSREELAHVRESPRKVNP